MKPHRVCPICHLSLYYFDDQESCKTFSHSFTQITSIRDNSLLSEEIVFPANYYGIKVNYVSNEIKIVFYTKNSKYISDKVVTSNRITLLDYPDLTKVHEKIKKLALFK